MSKDATPTRRFAAGEILFHEKDPGGELWIIKVGTVEVYRVRNGREFPLGKVGAGEILGTMTATTGGTRQASARALGPVEVSIIPLEQMAKLVKSIPSWANAFIKDLVARVSYANELYLGYALAYDAAQGPLVAPLELAARLVSTLTTLGELTAFESNGSRWVPLDATLERATHILGRKAELEQITALLIKHGLLTEGERDRSGRTVTYTSIAELKLFADVLQKTSKSQASDTGFVMPLAPSQRKALAELTRLSRQRGAVEGGVQVWGYKELEDEFRRSKVTLEASTLGEAAALGLLTIDKQAATPTVSVDPVFVDFSLRSLEALSSIAAMSAGAAPRKKTLLY